MAEWLTGEARAALRAAEDEARARRQTVGSPHLLLGLIADEAGKPAHALKAMGVPLDQVRHQTIRRIGIRYTKAPRRFRPKHSVRVRAILERAKEAAAHRGRPLVGVEDLLVAVVAERDGKAARIIAALRPPDTAENDRVPAEF